MAVLGASVRYARMLLVMGIKAYVVVAVRLRKVLEDIVHKVLHVLFVLQYQLILTVEITYKA